tara:strand:- start:2861 stop:4189 length:1329 start_codon:yes stop_codon:yes gene_type:complete
MQNQVVIKNRIGNYNEKILVPGDKSISIRWILVASLANGISTAKNLLISEDVIATINAVKKLGVKVKINKAFCKIYGVGINGYKYKRGITINAQNSGTLGRLISGLLIDTPFPIKIIGDKSLSKRDFKRIATPLRKFGAHIKLKNNFRLPLTIIGSRYLKPISYLEDKGSAQVKSAIIFAGAKTNGKTLLRASRSRNHTELLFKHLKLPIKLKHKKNFDLIEVSKINKIKALNYKIPSDLSSCAFFIILTLLSKNSSLLIKNVNVNPSRIGMITILKKMGAKIFFKNQKIYKGEKISDILVKSSKTIKSINCPSKLNSSTIDEFLLLFIYAAKATGVSYFKNLGELNKKESPRLKLGAKILNKMGIKTITTKDSIKIFGNPNLKVNKKIVIKNFLKDHRVFMTSVIAALSFKGFWTIKDKDSINSSFPNFLKLLKKLGAKIN